MSNTKLPGSMSRAYATDTVVRVGVNDFTSTLSNSDEIDLREMAGGSIQLADSCAVTSLTVYASDRTGGTYVPAYDDDNTLLTLITAAGTMRRLPEAIFGFPFIKLVGNVAGTVSLFLKS